MARYTNKNGEDWRVYFFYTREAAESYAAKHAKQYQPITYNCCGWRLCFERKSQVSCHNQPTPQ